MRRFRGHADLFFNWETYTIEQQHPPTNPPHPYTSLASADCPYSSNCRPLSLPTDATVPSALERVLRLLSVGSKRFLTNKVDRSVTGLIAQQQCVGPLQLPLSDVAVIAQSHFSTTGCALSIGEQPIKVEY